jgi:predicted phage terminase large subunit-like protein
MGSDGHVVVSAGERRRGRRRRCLMEQGRRRVARRELLPAMKFLWRNKSVPFLAGRHTVAACEAITEGVRRLEEGKSTYLIITMPFRHGKSEIASRHAPAWVMGRLPDLEQIEACHTQSLADRFSRDVAGVVESDRYKLLFPGVGFAKDNNAARTRGFEGHSGSMLFLGRGGAGGGYGASFLGIDDLIKNREEAESATVRDRAWEVFQSDLMTRLAPAHLVVVTSTRWHVDDVVGRIKCRLDPEHEAYDPDFPPFKEILFPALLPGGGYLWPERFSPEWYKRMCAVLGPYGVASLFQGEPTLRGGNMFEVGKVRVVDGFEPEFPGVVWVRFWDLASTEKERAKADPDYTVGAKVGVSVRSWVDVRSGDRVEEVTCLVDDVRWCQAEAPARDRLIRDTAEADGPAVHQYVESVAGYKDAVTTLRKALAGKALVHGVGVHSDKVARAAMMEPLVSAGRFVFRRGHWNRRVLGSMAAFPAGDHDDIEDALGGGLAAALRRYRLLAGVFAEGEGAGDGEESGSGWDF